MQVSVTRRLNDCRHAVSAGGLAWLPILGATIIGGLICIVLLGLMPGAAHAAINATGDVTPIPDGSDPWVLTDPLRVGDTGAGTLDIDNGSVVNGTNANIGTSAGSTGTATVTGAGSSWTNSTWLSIGNYGDGTLVIQDGGSVSNATGNIFGSTGVVTVNGEGSVWNNTGPLYVGINSTLVFPVDLDSSGTLNIEAGGTVTSLFAVIGDRRPSADEEHSGTAVITGAGSTWMNTGDLYVGRSRGSGTLIIENGGSVSNSNGNLAGATSEVTVSGHGATWANSGDLLMGGQGIFDKLANHKLNIQAGGSVTNVTGYIGYSSRTVSVATVSGVGSTWVNHADLNVGRGGSGTLNIENGGVVSSANGIIGGLNLIGVSSVNAATITGAGSAWNMAGSLAVGGNLTAVGSPGSLTVSDAAQVTVADTVKVWSSGTLQGDGAVSAATLSNAGTVSPGNSTGVLTLTSDYTQESAGKLVIEITGDGTQPGVDYDRLAVTGDVQLAGTLDVTLLDEASLTPGNRYDILTFTGTRSGRFNFTLLPTVPGVGLGIDYVPNAVTIVAILPGDLNGDGFVGINDLNIVLGNWNQYVPMWDLQSGDLNGDGYVGIEDLNAILGNWNAGTPPPPDISVAIPEPGTISILALSFLGNVGRRRTRLS